MRNRDRLTRLKKALKVLSEPLPEGLTFNMRTWGEKNSCGTYACLAGTLALHPWFQKRGFKAVWSKPLGNRSLLRPRPAKAYLGYGFNSMTEAFFGLTGYEADALTTAGMDDLDDAKGAIAIELKHVKARLRKLIKRYTKGSAR